MRASARGIFSPIFSLLSPLQLLLFDVKRPKPRILRGAAKLLLDAEKLVVLGDALAAAGGAGLDLAGVQRNGQVAIVVSSVSPERWDAMAV